MQLIKPNLQILVTGACGQIGTELVKALRARYGKAGVVATDIKPESSALLMEGQYHYLDVMDKGSLSRIVKQYGVTQIYHLAAVLSANGEKNPLNNLGYQYEQLAERARSAAAYFCDIGNFSE
jgi:nucleoside-diphosphate-sugar epimerase